MCRGYLRLSAPQPVIPNDLFRDAFEKLHASRLSKPAHPTTIPLLLRLWRNLIRILPWKKLKKKFYLWKFRDEINDRMYSPRGLVCGRCFSNRAKKRVPMTRRVSDLAFAFENRWKLGAAGNQNLVRSHTFKQKHTSRWYRSTTISIRTQMSSSAL